MNFTLGRLLLWASWFLASAILCSLLRLSVELIATRTLTPEMAQNFAAVAIGIIALIVTQEITQAYTGEPTS